MVLMILLIVYSEGHQCNDHPEQESKEREQAPWKKENKLRFLFLLISQAMFWNNKGQESQPAI